MNPAALSAFFAAHKTAVLGGGAAAVAALGLYQRKKNAAGSTRTTAGAAAPGTIPAAAVVGSSTAAYDSTAFDQYASLEQQIGDLAAQQQTSAPPSAAASATPGPIASTLFSPSGSTLFARYGNQVDQVQSDGSLYALTLPEWQALGSPTNYAQLGPTPTSAPAPVYSQNTNLATKIKNAPTGA